MLIKLKKCTWEWREKYSKHGQWLNRNSDYCEKTDKQNKLQQIFAELLNNSRVIENTEIAYILFAKISDIS